MLRALTATTLLSGIGLVQHGSENSMVSTTSVVFDLAAPTSDGDLLVVVTGWVNPAMYPVQAPTDFQGNTYVLVAQQASGPGNAQVIAIWYAQNIVGAQHHAITWGLAVSGAVPLSIEVAEFSGVDRANAFSGLVVSASTPPNSDAPDAGKVAGPQGSLVFGAMAHDLNATSAAGPGFTLLDIATDDAANYNPAIDEYAFTEGTAVPVTFTLSGAGGWVAIGAVFSPAVSDAGIDAGMDAGIDAGVDAGIDAGVDAGIDAGTDGGPTTFREADLTVACSCAHEAALGPLALLALVGCSRLRGRRARVS